MLVGDPERLKLAALRFARFFEELRGTFVERDEVLLQIGLALLGREHVLMTGPPGTAKSRLATATLGRVVDDETGRPSLFARQFTESTVQTDLVGPIDFKTLIETGRTEHFTDEGMLGAVHAFLDEVFDGRDMLLRSALNVLHERELKQGTKTTTGQIECAVMTSNRYLSEVLEGSRESLLAFIDRIAFVSFVPRGFSTQSGLGAVLSTQVAGARRRPPSALLTVQDLDVLQAATERVPVPEQICELLVTLLSSFEVEIAAAVRADPTFVPTRYLSTRTAVRLGNLLRAIVVHDWATGDRSRPLCAGRRDLHLLRLSLVSAGPTLEQIGALAEHESDPRERRQLSILRTEREIFERCFETLPPGPDHFAAPPASAASSSVVASERERAPEPADLRGRSIEELLSLVSELGQSAHAVDPGAHERMSEAVRHLAERLLLGGLDPTDADALAPRAAVERLAALAERLEESDSARRPLADWLRGQALELLHDCVLLGFPAAGTTLQAALADDADAAAIAQRLIDELGGLIALERALSVSGRRHPAERDRGEAGFQRALERLEHELVAIWSEGVRHDVARAWRETSAEDFSGMVGALASALERMAETERQLTELGGSGSELRRRVIGPQLTPFVRTAFERFDTSARARVVEQVQAALHSLRAAGLAQAISGAELLAWTAEALLRADPEPESAELEPSHDGYRALRDGEQRIALAYTLAELALSIAGGERAADRKPSELLALVRQQLAELPEPVRNAIIARDRARIERPIALLERWWSELEKRAAESRDPDRALSTLVRSRFFHVTRDEAALARFSLEARLLASAFPAAEVAAFERRLAELDQASLARVESLLAQRASARWQTLGDT